MALAYNIPVDIPQIQGAPTIDLQELRSKVQEYVNGLYIHIDITQKENTVHDNKYTKRLQRLREMSRKVKISTEDIKSDERLAYLLAK